MTITEHSEHKIIFSEEGALTIITDVDIVLVELPGITFFNHIKIIENIIITFYRLSWLVKGSFRVRNKFMDDLVRNAINLDLIVHFLVE